MIEQLNVKLVWLCGNTVNTHSCICHFTFPVLRPDMFTLPSAVPLLACSWAHNWKCMRIRWYMIYQDEYRLTVSIAVPIQCWCAETGVSNSKLVLGSFRYHQHTSSTSVIQCLRWKGSLHALQILVRNWKTRVPTDASTYPGRATWKRRLA